MGRYSAGLSGESKITNFGGSMSGYITSLKQELDILGELESQLSKSLESAKKQDGWQNYGEGVVKKADLQLKNIAENIQSKKNEIIRICDANQQIANDVDYENAKKSGLF